MEIYIFVLKIMKGYPRDIVDLVPDHGNKENITIRQDTCTFVFLMPIKVACTSYYSLMQYSIVCKSMSFSLRLCISENDHNHMKF